MSSKRSAEPSPASAARAERQRIAKEDGAQAVADAERRAVEVRQNMQRLRALREAREADEQAGQDNAVAAPQKPAKKKRIKRIVR